MLKGFFVRWKLAAVLTSVILFGCSSEKYPNLVSKQLEFQAQSLSQEFVAKEEGIHYVVLEVDRERAASDILCLLNIGSSEINRKRYGCATTGNIDKDINWKLLDGASVVESNLGQAAKYQYRGYFKQESIGKVLGWFCPIPGKKYELNVTLLRPLPQLSVAHPRILVGSVNSYVVGGLVANMDGPLEPKCPEKK